ncbi:putative membrane protein [Mariprofundus ferrinatatus]|uniref:Putative membrane protein n=1 Tax=Mariprofundus ferrinatatus TaxID=1921087 RepID=A0A2K8L5E0_9PROT|nr:NnrU family protein [Mariprofundus ferrinatatus]ATX81071.1 putative membrane protein [Mariprofundus ferrinatatus]
MELLIVGLVIFFAIHLIPAMGSLRSSLVGKFGDNGYKGIFALASLAGLVLIVLGKGDADFIEVYEPPSWGMHVTGLMMLLALVALVSFKLETSLRRITAHPMLWGITFWATGHLFANGDAASLLLFGSFLIYSLFAMASANRRGARPSGRKMALMQDGIALVVSSIIYVALMMMHAHFTGISLMS